MCPFVRDARGRRASSQPKVNTAFELKAGDCVSDWHGHQMGHELRPAAFHRGHFRYEAAWELRRRTADEDRPHGGRLPSRWEDHRAWMIRTSHESERIAREGLGRRIDDPVITCDDGGPFTWPHGCSQMPSRRVGDRACLYAVSGGADPHGRAREDVMA